MDSGYFVGTAVQLPSQLSDVKPRSVIALWLRKIAIMGRNLVINRAIHYIANNGAAFWNQNHVQYPGG